MIRRVVEISSRPAHLCVRLGQLVIRLHQGRAHCGTPAEPTAEGEGAEETKSVPCEDLGVLLVDNPQVTYTHQALATMAAHGAAVVICGPTHLPVGLLLPMQEHTEVLWRVQEQVRAGEPLRKRLWRQIVAAKVLGQARNLHPDSSERRLLTQLARQVKSGDVTNVEAKAARAYWRAWSAHLAKARSPCGERATFRRDPQGTDIANSLLNYGYAVLRAAVARALVAAGLFPALGIHHRNRSDAFALADDLMEPFRPWVDARALDCLTWAAPPQQLDQQGKRAMLELLTATVRLEGTTGPLMVALHRMCASLVECYRGERKGLLIPQLPDETDR